MAENLFQVPYMKDQIVEEMKLSSALKHRFIYLTEDVDLDACFKLNYYLDRIVRLDEKMGQKNQLQLIFQVLVEVYMMDCLQYQGLKK